MMEGQVLVSKFQGNNISAVLDNSQSAWFKGIEVATTLGYRNPRSTIHKKVKPNEKKYIKKLCCQNGYAGQSRQLTYINEAGLYRLIFSSKLPIAETFKTWVFTEVLPNLRKATLLDRQILFNETDLHHNVIKFIRTYYNEVKVVPGLGEYQDKPWKRSDGYYKGYSGGQPDIVIPLTVRRYNGLAIELKNPLSGGKVSYKQKEWHDYLKGSGYLLVVSSDYKEVTKVIAGYIDEVRLSCQPCKKYYKYAGHLTRHKYLRHTLSPL